MEISRLSTGASPYGRNAVKGDAAPTAGEPPERRPSQVDGNRVQLSAEAQRQYSSAQAPAHKEQVKEAASGQTDQEQSRKALEERELRAEQARQVAAQRGFAFHGVAAYRRVSSS